MRKKIIEKIYCILLLTTIFSSSYVMVHDISLSDNVSCTDTTIELLEDSDMADLTQTSIEYDGISESVFLLNYDNFFNTTNIFLYLQNTYEIYLGLNIPPPKYL